MHVVVFSEIVVHVENLLYPPDISFRKRLDQSKSPRVRLQRLEKCLDQKVTMTYHLYLLVPRALNIKVHE